MAVDTFERLLGQHIRLERAGPSSTPGSPQAPLTPYATKADDAGSAASAFTGAALLENGTLPFEAVSSDGGNFSRDYACHNMLVDDGSCYCSEKSAGINVVLTLRDRSPFTLTRVDIRAPIEGFTSPLGQGLIFISWDYPSLADTSQYDDVRSCSDYQRILRDQVDQKGWLDECDPVLFFDLGDFYSTSVSFDVPRAGRYVLLKLLRPRNNGDVRGTGVDVQYVGLHGWTGTRGFPAADLC